MSVEPYIRLGIFAFAIGARVLSAAASNRAKANKKLRPPQGAPLPPPIEPSSMGNQNASMTGGTASSNPLNPAPPAMPQNPPPMNSKPNKKKAPDNPWSDLK